MATRKNRADLQEEADKLFKRYPQTEKLYATTDGQFFLPKQRGLAANHARILETSVIEFERGVTYSDSVKEVSLNLNDGGLGQKIAQIKNTIDKVVDKVTKKTPSDLKVTSPEGGQSALKVVGDASKEADASEEVEEISGDAGTDASESDAENGDVDNKPTPATPDQNETQVKPADPAPEKGPANPGSDDAAGDTLPEGTPNKEDWTVPQIKQWLKQRDVKFAYNSKEDTLLKKVNEYLNKSEK